MLRSDVSATSSRVVADGERIRSYVEPTPASLARSAVERLGAVLRYGASDAPGTRSRGQDTAAETLPPFAGRERDGVDIFRIVDLPTLPPRRPPSASLHPLQEWEGYVVEVGERDFTARLIDLTAGASREEEEAVIPMEEVSDSDAAKMREGSIFRWVIGYERSPAGTKKRVSQIVFRDLPAVTKTDLRRGEAWAREAIRSLGP